jgi:hypothetical protein
MGNGALARFGTQPPAKAAPAEGRSSQGRAWRQASIP